MFAELFAGRGEGMWRLIKGLFEGNPVCWLIVGVIVLCIIFKAAINSASAAQVQPAAQAGAACQECCPTCSEPLSASGSFCRHCKQWLK